MRKKIFLFIFAILLLSTVNALYYRADIDNQIYSITDVNQALYNRGFESSVSNIALMANPACSGNWCAEHDANVLFIESDNSDYITGTQSLFVNCGDIANHTPCETTLYAKSEDATDSNVSFYAKGVAAQFIAGYVNDNNVFSSVLTLNSGTGDFFESGWKKFSYIIPQSDDTNKYRVAFKIKTPVTIDGNFDNLSVDVHLDDISIVEGTTNIQGKWSQYTQGLTETGAISSYETDTNQTTWNRDFEDSNFSLTAGQCSDYWCVLSGNITLSRSNTYAQNGTYSLKNVINSGAMGVFMAKDEIVGDANVTFYFQGTISGGYGFDAGYVDDYNSFTRAAIISGQFADWNYFTYYIPAGRYRIAFTGNDNNPQTYYLDNIKVIRNNTGTFRSGSPTSCTSLANCSNITKHLRANDASTLYWVVDFVSGATCTWNKNGIIQGTMTEGTNGMFYADLNTTVDANDWKDVNLSAACTKVPYVDKHFFATPRLYKYANANNGNFEDSNFSLTAGQCSADWCVKNGSSTISRSTAYAQDGKYSLKNVIGTVLSQQSIIYAKTQNAGGTTVSFYFRGLISGGMDFNAGYVDSDNNYTAVLAIAGGSEFYDWNYFTYDIPDGNYRIAFGGNDNNPQTYYLDNISMSSLKSTSSLTATNTLVSNQGIADKNYTFNSAYLDESNNPITGATCKLYVDGSPFTMTYNNDTNKYTILKSFTTNTYSLIHECTSDTYNDVNSNYSITIVDAPSVGVTTVSGFTVYSTFIVGTGNIIGGTATAGLGINTTTCEYTINGGTTWATADWNTDHCEKTGINIDNNVSTFNTRVQDLNGNIGTGTATSTYIPDIVAPITSSDVANDTNTDTLKMTVTLTCTDSNKSGCATTTYCTDTNDTCTPTTTYTTPFILTCPAGIEGCIYYARFSSTDNIGNAESTKTTGQLGIPTSPPSGGSPAGGGNDLSFNYPAGGSFDFNASTIATPSLVGITFSTDIVYLNEGETKTVRIIVTNKTNRDLPMALSINPESQKYLTVTRFSPVLTASSQDYYELTVSGIDFNKGAVDSLVGFSINSGQETYTHPLKIVVGGGSLFDFFGVSLFSFPNELPLIGKDLTFGLLCIIGAMLFVLYKVTKGKG